MNGLLHKLRKIVAKKRIAMSKNDDVTELPSRRFSFFIGDILIIVKSL